MEMFDKLNANRNELAFLIEQIDVSVSLCASLLRIRKTIDTMGSLFANNMVLTLYAPIDEHRT
jgi:hypothetical protein